MAGPVAKFGFAAHFQAAARLGRFDLYHEPNFVPFRTGLPLVVTVFDLSVLLFPQWHPAERVKAHEAAFARGVRAGLDRSAASGVLLRRLFSARALGLVADLECPAVASYLSGLLIGSAVREAGPLPLFSLSR